MIIKNIQLCLVVTGFGPCNLDIQAESFEQVLEFLDVEGSLTGVDPATGCKAKFFKTSIAAVAERDSGAPKLRSNLFIPGVRN